MYKQLSHMYTGCSWIFKYSTVQYSWLMCGMPVYLEINLWVALTEACITIGHQQEFTAQWQYLREIIYNIYVRWGIVLYDIVVSSIDIGGIKWKEQDLSNWPNEKLLLNAELYSLCCLLGVIHKYLYNLNNNNLLHFLPSRTKCRIEEERSARTGTYALI